MKPAMSAGSRGIALLEALLAVSLLATGAAGLARIHARLTWAGDEIRHQGEALWLAQQALERAHGSLSVSSTRWSGASADFDIQGHTTDVAPGGSTSLTLIDTFPLRSAQVSVAWTDRTGQRHTVDLQTLISTADPALHAWLTRADG
ncbi:hypothetical protein SAMN05216359_10575 [Roseateles sp. YR242]|uniref:type IV pilus modification PilV family protein n=1 Tax=Roseateles sp. YR242 TaxID=1855305 RepID=UPI0008AC3EAA|nr:hypothetical protein [Roseateles sp. YR242]SEL07752.1 hypothetical protein SAMN05216359_10575 [Roseateles sp. YR242]